MAVNKCLPVYLLKFIERCRFLQEQLWSKIYHNLQAQFEQLSQESELCWDTLQQLLEEERSLVKELILSYELLKSNCRDLVKVSLLSPMDWKIFHQKNLESQKVYLQKKEAIVQKLSSLASKCQEEKKNLVCQRFSRLSAGSYTKAYKVDIIA